MGGAGKCSGQPGMSWAPSPTRKNSSSFWFSHFLANIQIEISFAYRETLKVLIPKVNQCSQVEKHWLNPHGA